MSGRAQARLLPDGRRRRLHLQDGPIDLVIEVFGPGEVVVEAYRAATAAFEGLLDELCAERPRLWAAASGDGHLPRGPVARRMARAVGLFAHETFITPMAAVAGAVADHILAAIVRDPRVARAYVNNGGDIAVHVAPGERLTIGLIDRPDRPSLLGQVAVESGDGIGGIATSGWRGRSFSLGIADAVTVLARSAAEADAAATIVANAVDLPGHPAVTRVPAESLSPDSDLGARLVTRDVGPLTEAEIARALAAGLARAHELLARGLILGAALQVQSCVRIARSQTERGAVLLPLPGEGGEAEGRDGWGSPPKSAASRTPPVALRAPPSPKKREGAPLLPT